MTLLVSLFTLLGLILYLYGRIYFLQQKVIEVTCGVPLAIIIGGSLAIFSKENGILLVFTSSFWN
ncbi:MAG: hypothetical protein R3E08_11395 [Thiotrichaceae bacterium]